MDYKFSHFSSEKKRTWVLGKATLFILSSKSLHFSYKCYRLLRHQDSTMRELVSPRDIIVGKDSSIKGTKLELDHLSLLGDEKILWVLDPKDVKSRNVLLELAKLEGS